MSHIKEIIGQIIFLFTGKKKFLSIFYTIRKVAAWGEGLAVFWGTTVPVDRLAITGQLLTAIGFKEEAIALDHIMEWANMCSLSTIKKSNFKMPIKRKGFYIAIIEVVFIINGQDVGSWRCARQRRWQTH